MNQINKAESPWRPLLAFGTLILSLGLAAPSSFSDAPSGQKKSEQKGFVANIGQETKANSDFRHVLYTGKRMQLVLMTLKAGEEIGEEVHPNTDQFFRVEEGSGEVWINGHSSPIRAETAIVVPAGSKHNVKNTGQTPLKLYTLYSPPQHADKTVQKTKSEAEMSQEHFNGVTSE